ncbi:hypothetical protein Z950_2949 [Sulfitobacter mediterraneus KCTC 32188]|nr:hypothetical protein Z950_2949 [Sulfitobacter mediterraneus KCTC 32188]
MKKKASLSSFGQKNLRGERRAAAVGAGPLERFVGRLG